MDDILDNAPKAEKWAYFAAKGFSMAALACAFTMGLLGMYFGLFLGGILAIFFMVVESYLLDRLCIDYFLCCLEQHMRDADSRFEIETEKI